MHLTLFLQFSIYEICSHYDIKLKHFILFIFYFLKNLPFQIFKNSEFNLFQCFFLLYVLQGIAIDECVLMFWKKHSDGVLDVLIDNTNILSEKVGDAALRL